MHKTTHKDLRYSEFHCGICGSYRTTHSGVFFCERCNSEECFTTELYYNWWNPESMVVKRICDCGKPTELHYITKYIIHCLDCGAVKSYICPECDNISWKNDTRNEFFCKKCDMRAKLIYE